MFGNVTNHVSGLGTSLGSWFKKEKEEPAPESEDKPSTQPEEAPKEEEKKVKSESKKKDDDAASVHSGATESADSDVVSEPEDEAKPGFAGLAAFSGMGEKASASAKSVGSFFGTAFSKASASVKEASTKIKETVEKTPILNEFNKEQEAFIKAKGGKTGEALPPWVGYPNEEKLKEEILSLSTERKNFVRNPTTGVSFEFDLEQFLPVAQATLAVDSNLEDMRFQLVPKVVTEEVFWRNYFYRVGLLRQSVQMENLETSPSETAPATEEKEEEDWEAELREELGGFEVVEGGKEDKELEQEIEGMLDTAEDFR